MVKLLILFFLIPLAWSNDQVLDGLYLNNQVHHLDIDGNGLQDIVVTSTSRPSVRVQFQEEKGNFKSSIITQLNHFPNDTVFKIYVGRFDNDLFYDLLVVYKNSLMAFYQGTEEGEFFFKSSMISKLDGEQRSFADQSGVVLYEGNFKNSRQRVISLSPLPEEEFPFALDYFFIDYSEIVEDREAPIVELESLKVAHTEEGPLYIFLDVGNNRILYSGREGEAQKLNLNFKPYETFLYTVESGPKLIVSPAFDSQTIESEVFSFKGKEVQSQFLKTGSLIWTGLHLEEAHQVLLFSEKNKILKIFDLDESGLPKSESMKEYSLDFFPTELKLFESTEEGILLSSPIEEENSVKLWTLGKSAID